MTLPFSIQTFAGSCIRVSLVNALFEGERTVFLNTSHVVAVLPESCEVLTSCGVVYKLHRGSMDGLVSILGGDL